MRAETASRAANELGTESRVSDSSRQRKSEMDMIDFATYRAERHASAKRLENPSTPSSDEAIPGCRESLQEIWYRFKDAICELDARLDSVLTYT